MTCFCVRSAAFLGHANTHLCMTGECTFIYSWICYVNAEYVMFMIVNIATARGSDDSIVFSTVATFFSPITR